jgi:hypothetical protein
MNTRVEMTFLTRHFVNAIALVCGVCSAASGATWTATNDDARGVTTILLDGAPFTVYHYRDATTTRPYFASVFAPTGVKITRNFPPKPGDLPDHEVLHPGMWLAFGDISGADSWRLTAPVDHVKFVQPPTAKDGELHMSVENCYRAVDGKKRVCKEVCKYRFVSLPYGVLVMWDSRFSNPDAEFVFGDQEEQGLGVRMAASVGVYSNKGGRILNSNGQRNEKEAWSKSADWCDYSGPVGEPLGTLFVGATIIPHPENFRRAWCHCRDNGFMAMNPFGNNAFTGGEKSAIKVEPGEEFRLRYGVLFHWGDSMEAYDPAEGAKQYVQLSKDGD